MRKAFLRFTAILFAGAAFLGTATFSYAGDKPWQSWNQIDADFALHKQFDLTTSTNLRLRDGMSKLYQFFPEVGLKWKPFSFFYVKPCYRYMIAEDSNNKKRNENRMTLESGLKHTMFDFGLSYRFRMEYRMVEHKGGYWRFRNKFGIERVIKVFGFEVAPYGADEFFYSNDVHQVNENRAQVGVSKKIIKNVRLDLYIMFDSKRKGNIWNTYNVLGTKLGFNFG
ncbi:MAG: DUF2490 domain-containing protein [Candidatus Omnitrophica bacterium]|nr:DUF2490 domain-containing protein [Candidatus Omnitrophota bacterium]